MRTRLDELLRAIRQRPADAELRLVYADALEEAGESLRAEVIRRSLGDEDREWVDRTINEHEEELAGPAIAKHAREWRFERGLVSWVSATFTDLAAHGADMFRSAPIARLTIVEGDDDDDPTEETGEALAEIRELVQLESVDLFTGAFPKQLLAAFTASPYLTALRHVTFMYGDELAIAEVFSRAELPALRELAFWMESGSHGDEVTSLIAGSEHRRALTRLEISGCEPSDEAVRAIVDSPYLHALTHVLFGSSHYSSTNLTIDATTAIANAEHLHRLEWLHLPQTGLDDASFVPLTTTRAFQLKALNVAENGLTDRSVEALLAWPNASHLQYLDVSGNSITDAAREALRTAPCLSKCQLIVG